MADNTKNSGLQSLPPKEAKSNVNLNYLKDPVFGSPEYDTLITKEEFRTSFSAVEGFINFNGNTTPTPEGDQNAAISKFIKAPDVGGTVIKAAEMTGEVVTLFGGAGLDIAKMVTGLEKTPKPKEKSLEDQQKEMANRQNTSVVQRAIQEAAQISELNHQKHIRDLEGDAASFSDEQKNKIEHLQANFKKKPTFLDARSIREAMAEQKRKEEMQKPSPFNKGGKGTLSSQRANQNEAPEGGGALATVTRGPQ